MPESIVSLRPPWRVLLVVIAFLALIIRDGGPRTEACSPVGRGPLTDVERVIHAEVVLYGRVRATYPFYPDNGFNHSSETSVYTANIEVYCIMKGARTEQFVNISEAGVCYSPNMTVGHSYVILAMRDDDDGKYRPSDGEFDASDRQLLKRLATACGLQAVYPLGVEESTATVKCPTPAPPGECISSGSRSKMPTLSIYALFLVIIMLN